MNKKNNKESSVKAPTLDLSFAYGTAVMKQLSAGDIEAMQAREAEQGADSSEESTGDTTIRAVTSFFTGTRSIVSLDDVVDDDSEDPGQA